MKKLNGFILSFALMLVSSLASAQVGVAISGDSGTSTIPPEHIQSISIDPVTSVVSITTNVAYTVQLAEAEEPPCTVDCGDVAPTITAFNVASPVTVGGSTTVSWSSTDNATSCTPSGNYAGWNGLSIPTNSNGINVPMNFVGTYTFGLTCNNGTLASTTINRTIVVNDVVVNPTPADACEGYVAPLSGTTLRWTEVFAEPFPNPGYANEYAYISRSGYTAIEFDSANFIDTGSLQTIEVTTTSGSRLGSISQCPGDFDVAPECTYTWGTSGGIVWSTENYGGACQLDPNTTYYFNLTFTDGYDPATTGCGDSRCITKVRVYNP